MRISFTNLSLYLKSQHTHSYSVSKTFVWRWTQRPTWLPRTRSSWQMWRKCASRPRLLQSSGNTSTTPHSSQRQTWLSFRLLQHKWDKFMLTLIFRAHFLAKCWCFLNTMEQGGSQNNRWCNTSWIQVTWVYLANGYSTVRYMLQTIYFGYNKLSVSILLVVWKVGDFLHFWRVNGWYLGVKDENNAALEATYF